MLIYTCIISSVLGPYRPINPYVKPFFPPDPPQMTALYKFFVVLFARVSRFNHVFTFSRYDFSFDHVFCVHLTF